MRFYKAFIEVEAVVLLFLGLLEGFVRASVPRFGFPVVSPPARLGK